VGHILVAPLHPTTRDEVRPAVHYWWAGKCSGLRPVGIIDHILLTQSFGGVVTAVGIEDGPFWCSLTDHRPVLLGLHLKTTTNLRPSRSIPRPSFPLIEASALPADCTAYSERLLQLLPAHPHTSAAAASDYLYQVCNGSATIAADFLPRMRRRSRRWMDGWSSTLICLKTHMATLWDIWRHLRGLGGRAHWTMQSQYDERIRPLIQRWEDMVHSFTWPSASTPHTLLEITGKGPSYWRLARLQELPAIIGAEISAIRKRMRMDDNTRY